MGYDEQGSNPIEMKEPGNTSGTTQNNPSYNTKHFSVNDAARMVEQRMPSIDSKDEFDTGVDLKTDKSYYRLDGHDNTTDVQDRWVKAVVALQKQDVGTGLDEAG